MAKRIAAKRRRPGRARSPTKQSLSAPKHYLSDKVAAYLSTMFGQTILAKVIGAFLVLWFLFAAALYLSERGVPGSSITSYGDALYWSVAAFSTAGIADTPRSGLSQLVGGIWIIVGSIIFFGTIVATITSYFMRPIERPVHQIVETIEYNLERLDELSVDELTLLKKTSDALIAHMERLKQREAGKDDAIP